ncbi:tetratricopeptide repeat protein [Flammeovirga kamogawensis]|uniref:Tetratricopeptide repeat protein n=1 Tax=Flammeovirga kamogawensis TaxID=373891 RepID=A0ABX8H3Q6_9BACT|nr:tetratricopeptide repeat protein [Flammeovirga kamogawensis]MBB6463937.1 tetratricopeptide (TPR) repeat protein [Flammeovirga kamogawensis]QWG09785.1 tetratricopeptide repeat protein [Flammeovirga kamogawensis]TRX65295.1 tetratricopeptide repeat protein [Flammeovirga kamogawensis]
MKATTIILTVLLCVFQTFSFAQGQNSDSEIFIRKGIELHDNGKYKKAIKQYKKALKLNNEDVLALYELAMSYLAMEDYNKSIYYSKKVIELDKDDNSTILGYVNYGTSLDMLGKQDEALKVYEKGMLRFNYYLLYYNHAVTALSMNKIELARESAISSITVNPNHGSSHLLLSKTYLLENKLTQFLLSKYFFFLVEPSSQRSSIEYSNLKKLQHLDKDLITKDDKGNLNLNLNFNVTDDTTYLHQEIFLLSAKTKKIINPSITDTELFVSTVKGLFETLEDFKSNEPEFVADFYIPIYQKIQEKKLTEPFAYFILQGSEPDAKKWLENNEKELERLYSFFSADQEGK